MLAYPPGYPRAPPVRSDRPRASDTDRDTAVDILCAAASDGRLTLAELDERVGAALSARTRSELLALISDLASRPGTPLPSRPGTTAAARSGHPAARPPAPASGQRGGAAARFGQPAGRSPAPATAPSRWPLLQSLIDTWASPAPA
ncbi:MAG: DUF1707 domain-containing protein [Trebonia sp.]|jgi:hypothetical protein